MYQGCIFDLDGTLVDSIEAIAYSVNLTFQELHLPTIPVKDFYTYVGDGYKVLIERCLRAVKVDVKEYFEVAAAGYKRNFKANILYHVTPYEGIVEVLETLKQQGVKLAIVSNKPHERAKDTVEGVFGLELFDYIQGEQEEKGIYKKPDVSGVNYVLEQLGLKKEECLYIGDTNTDMITGKNVGIDTVGVLWGFRTEEELKEYHPKYIIKDTREILDCVKNS